MACKCSPASPSPWWSGREEETARRRRRRRRLRQVSCEVITGVWSGVSDWYLCERWDTDTGRETDTNISRTDQFRPVYVLIIFYK